MNCKISETNDLVTELKKEILKKAAFIKNKIKIKKI